MLGNLKQMFNDIITTASKGHNRSDKMQLTIEHGALKDNVYVHLRDLELVDAQTVLDRFEKVERVMFFVEKRLLCELVFHEKNVFIS